MIVLYALAIAAIFGAGVYLLLKRDVLRIVAGTILISNSVILFLMAAALSRGSAPIYPLPPDRPVSDPLVQALALTAIVISFGVTAFLLALVYRVFRSSSTLDREELAQAEARERKLD